MHRNNPQGVNTGNPFMGAAHIDRYLGSSFDIVYAVYKRLDSIVKIHTFIDTLLPTLEDITAYNTTILNTHIEIQADIQNNKEIVLEAKDIAIESKDVALETKEKILQALAESSYQDVGGYEEGLILTQANQTFIKDGVSYKIKHKGLLPKILSGIWENDYPYLMESSFLSKKLLDKEILRRQLADANLQMQISGASPLEASAFSPISWHSQEIENSVTIPENKNAWSFGPTMTIAAGQSVTIGENAHWTIANGEVQ